MVSIQDHGFKSGYQHLDYLFLGYSYSYCPMMNSVVCNRTFPEALAPVTSDDDARKINTFSWI